MFLIVEKATQQGEEDASHNGLDSMHENAFSEVLFNERCLVYVRWACPKICAPIAKHLGHLNLLNSYICLIPEPEPHRGLQWYVPEKRSFDVNLAKFAC